MIQPRKTITLTIAAGQTTSDVAEIPSGYSVAGVIIQAVHTGATLGFAAAARPSGTYYTCRDSDGAAVSVPSSATGAIGLSALEADAMVPWGLVKAVSAGVEAVARTIELMLI